MQQQGRPGDLFTALRSCDSLPVVVGRTPEEERADLARRRAPGNYERGSRPQRRALSRASVRTLSPHRRIAGSRRRSLRLAAEGRCGAGQREIRPSWFQESNELDRRAWPVVRLTLVLEWIYL